MRAARGAAVGQSKNRFCAQRNTEGIEAADHLMDAALAHRLEFFDFSQ